MLAVERSNNLPGIEVGERENRHLREADALRFRLINSPLQNRRDVNLYHRTIGAHETMRAGTRLPLPPRLIYVAIFAFTCVAMRPMAASIAASDSG